MGLLCRFSLLLRRINLLLIPMVGEVGENRQVEITVQTRGNRYNILQRATKGQLSHLLANVEETEKKTYYFK